LCVWNRVIVYEDTEGEMCVCVCVCVCAFFGIWLGNNFIQLIFRFHLNMSHGLEHQISGAFIH